MNKFEEEDQRNILQVPLEGQTIFFILYICKRKFDVDNSTLSLAFMIFHYLRILTCNIIIECLINFVMIIEYLVTFSVAHIFFMVVI